MDFARCYGCRKPVWTSQDYIARYGIKCPLCEGTMRTGISVITPYLRAWILVKYMRHGFFELNPWYGCVLPWNLAKAAWIGLHPEPLAKDPPTEKPSVIDTATSVKEEIVSQLTSNRHRKQYEPRGVVHH